MSLSNRYKVRGRCSRRFLLEFLSEVDMENAPRTMHHAPIIVRNQQELLLELYGPIPPRFLQYQYEVDGKWWCRPFRFFFIKSSFKNSTCIMQRVTCTTHQLLIKCYPKCSWNYLGNFCTLVHKSIINSMGNAHNCPLHFFTSSLS